MIIIITYKEKNKTIVSHGIDTKNDKNIVLQQEPIEYYTYNNLAYFDNDLNEYILR
tara:strand:- start:466 stop:633 length:168 start_codon:yes stop_codon:yes gene_type:complete